MIAVFGVKNAPGATTTALLLAAWAAPAFDTLAAAVPQMRSGLLVEADPAGSDLVVRLYGPAGQVLPAEPSVVQLAVACGQPGDAVRDLGSYALRNSADVAIVFGLPSFKVMDQTLLAYAARMAALLKPAADVVVDAGRLDPRSPTLGPFAGSADVVVVVVADSAESFAHARDWIGLLARNVCTDGKVASVVLPVVVSDRRGDGAANELHQVLRAASVDVATPMRLAYDPAGVAAVLNGGVGAAAKSKLVRSGSELAAGVAALAQQVRRARTPAGADHRVWASRSESTVAGAQVWQPAAPLGPPAAGFAAPAARHRPGEGPAGGAPGEDGPRRMAWPPRGAATGERGSA